MCPCVRLYIGDCPRRTKLHSNVRAYVCMCLCVRVCVFSFFCLVIVIQLSPAPAPSQRAGTIHSIALSATDTPLLRHPSTLCHTSHPILALIPKVYSLKKKKKLNKIRLFPIFSKIIPFVLPVCTTAVFKCTFVIFAS